MVRDWHVCGHRGRIRDERFLMSSDVAADRPTGSVRELTVRGIVIGALITLVFTAANVYLGLKVGLTFATSIPAAVISMAILRRFASHTVVENNIVQTIASAAGTLSAIVFVLPGLVMIGWWTGFPYWTTMIVCVVGGILGVMYSIPLRRALVTNSDLPYPEGVAGAEVLKVGERDSGDEGKLGLKAIIFGGVSAAAFNLLADLKLIGTSLAKPFRVGSGATSVGAGLSFALIGVGHLVGLSVGVAMFVGVIIGRGFLLPWRTAGQLGSGSLGDVASATFSTDVRFIGAGAMAVAAVWTLIKIIGPIVTGIVQAAASARQRGAGEEVELVERDIPITIVGLVTLLSMIPVGLLLWLFTRGTPLADNAGGLVLVGVVFVLLIGLIVASVCGYMAGLIGASNSPISGVGIVVVLAAAALIKTIHGGTSEQMPALVAFTLFTAAVVFGVATISNDNLQDLKTGQLVKSTPWKQQVALVIGVVFGSLVIPPVLELMNTAFGFVGAPGAGTDALAAPQASLISSLAQGVFGGDLDWGLLGVGALIGVGVVVVDEVLRVSTHKRAALPPLAVGMGIYLPMELTILITIGAVIGTFYNRWADRRSDPDRARRLGVLMATGLIVGESLFGVVYAGVVAASGKPDPLALIVTSADGKSDSLIAAITSPTWVENNQWLGLVIFAAAVVVLYRWVIARVKQHLA